MDRQPFWRGLLAGVESDGAAVAVTVLHVEGSTPREVGARMSVFADESFQGTIGGGQLEYQAIRSAARLISEGAATARRESLPLGPRLGQCCGGRVDLLFECFTKSSAEALSRLADRETIGPFRTTARIQGSTSLSRQILTAADDPAAGQSLDAPSISVTGDTLTETFGEARCPLYLFGAGHVGKALMLTLAPLPFDVTWVDQRRDVFPSAVPGSFSCLASDDPVQVLSQAPAGSVILIVTHDHALDLELTDHALAAKRFSYIGLIGSRTKRKRFETQLVKRGHAPETLERLICPIGDIGINSKRPAFIAAAVTAEILGHLTRRV